MQGIQRSLNNPHFGDKQTFDQSMYCFRLSWKVGKMKYDVVILVNTNH